MIDLQYACASCRQNIMTRAISPGTVNVHHDLYGSLPLR
jgi:hypothetical protein